MKGSDRDVSTVVLHLVSNISFYTRPADSCNFCVIEKLARACYFQIALETMLLSILTT